MWSPLWEAVGKLSVQTDGAGSALSGGKAAVQLVLELLIFKAWGL